VPAWRPKFGTNARQHGQSGRIAFRQAGSGMRR
jgi:hypothetical protein